MAISTGDNVSWRTSQGTAHGTVVDRRTKDFTLDGRHFTASDDEPMFVVRSAKTGTEAAHRESALRRT